MPLTRFGNGATRFQFTKHLFTLPTPPSREGPETVGRGNRRNCGGGNRKAICLFERKFQRSSSAGVRCLRKCLRNAQGPRTPPSSPIGMIPRFYIYFRRPEGRLAGPFFEPMADFCRL